MNDLQARFRRLDRVNAPDLWNEAVGRAAEMELAPRRSFNPGIALIAVALLLAALAGTIVVGSWLNRQDLPLVREYENGWLTTQDACGRVVGIDVATLESRELTAVDCGADWTAQDPVAWSSDGRWMIHLAPAHMATQNADPTSDTTAIWLYDAETGESQPVGTCRAFFCGVDISPDGSMVSYLTERGIAIKEIKSGAKYDVDVLGVSSTPQFSPDGRSLAFTVNGGQTGVHVIDVADIAVGIDTVPTLVYGIVATWEATWSPDGEWVAFLRETSTTEPVGQGTAWGGDLPTTTALWVVRRDGSGARPLTTPADGEVYGRPTWSPDSTSIAFSTGTHGPQGEDAGPEGEDRLWIVGIDDTAPTQIYQPGGSVPIICPAWSPDGEWIAFGVEAESSDRSGLLVVRPDGTDAQVVSDQTLIPIWQPIPAD